MKIKFIEFDVTSRFFGVGLSTSSERDHYKFIALIIGFLVIRFNLK